MGSPYIFPLTTYEIDYGGMEVEREDGWDLQIDLQRYVDWMESWYAHDFGILWVDRLRSGLALMDMSIGLAVVEEAWHPPGGFFDFNTMAHPGGMTNVQNGFGFIGGGYRMTTFPTPSRRSLEAAGFFDFISRR